MAIFIIFGLIILSVMIVTYWCIAVAFFKTRLSINPQTSIFMVSVLLEILVIVFLIALAIAGVAVIFVTINSRA